MDILILQKEYENGMAKLKKEQKSLLRRKQNIDKKIEQNEKEIFDFQMKFINILNLIKENKKNE